MADLKLQPDEIEVFRAGTYPQGDYSETDIAEIASAYDPENEHRGFIGVDPGYKHGKAGNEGRAYGLFSSLRANGASLIGKLAEGVPQPVKDAFKTGEVNGWSAEIWPEYTFNDGRVGKYFKGIKLLGITPPQIKGLKAAFDFSDAEHGRIEAFDMNVAPYAPSKLADVLKADETRRELSDIQWAFSRETEKVMCASDLTAAEKRVELNRLAQELASLTEGEVEQYEEDPVAEPTKKPEEKPAVPAAADPAQFAELQSQFAEMKKTNEALAAKAAAQDKLIDDLGRGVIRGKIQSFSEQAAKEGKLTKGDVESGVDAFMEAIEPVFFEVTSGEKTEKVSALAWFQEHVGKRIVALPKGTVVGKAKAGGDVATFSAETDLSSAEFADQVNAYSEEHKISYREAYKKCVALVQQLRSA